MTWKRAMLRDEIIQIHNTNTKRFESFGPSAPFGDFIPFLALFHSTERFTQYWRRKKEEPEEDAKFFLQRIWCVWSDVRVRRTNSPLSLNLFCPFSAFVSFVFSFLFSSILCCCCFFFTFFSRWLQSNFGAFVIWICVWFRFYNLNLMCMHERTRFSFGRHINISHSLSWDTRSERATLTRTEQTNERPERGGGCAICFTENISRLGADDASWHCNHVS